MVNNLIFDSFSYKYGEYGEYCKYEKYLQYVSSNGMNLYHTKLKIIFYAFFENGNIQNLIKKIM